MAEKVTIQIRVDDQGTPQIKQTRKSIDRLNTSARKAGAGMEEAEKSTKSMGSTAQKGAKSSGGMKNALSGINPAAIAGAAGMAAVTQAAQKATEVFAQTVTATKDMVLGVADTADEAAKMSAELGTTAEVVQEMEHVADITGASMSEMSTGMRRMSKAVNDAQQGGGETAEILDELGVATENAGGKTRDNVKIFEDTVEALAGVDDSVKQSAQAQKIFGRSGTKMLRTAEKAGMSLEELRGQARELGFVMDEETAEAAEAFNDRINNASRSLDAAKVAFSEQVFESDQVNQAIVEVGEAFQSLAQWVRDNEEVIEEWVDQAGIVARAAIEETTAAAQEMGQAFLDMSGDAEESGETVGSIFDELLAQSSDFLDTAGSIGTTIRDVAEFTPSGWLAGKVFPDTAQGAKDLSDRLDGVRERAQRLREERAIQDEMDEWADSLGAAGDALLDTQEYIEGILPEQKENSDQTEREAKARAESAKKEKMQEEAASLRRDAMREEDEIRANALEHMAERLEIQARGLPEQQEKLALERASNEAMEDQRNLEEERQSALDATVSRQMEMVGLAAELPAQQAETTANLQRQQQMDDMRIEQLDHQRENLGEIDQMKMAEIERDRRLLEIEQEGLKGKKREKAIKETLLDFERKELKLTEQKEEKERKMREERKQAARAQMTQIDQRVNGLGTLAASMSELQDESWDFEEANTAAVAAVGALGDIGGEAADALAEEREDQAMIEGSFHAAAALAATAMAFMNPGLAAMYGAAAANHAIAAGQFFAIAGGAGGGGSGGGGTGGGGGSSAGTNPQSAGEMEVPESGGGETTIINDFRGATTLEDSPTVKRRVRDATEEAQRDRFVAGGR